MEVYDINVYSIKSATFEENLLVVDLTFVVLFDNDEDGWKKIKTLLDTGNLNVFVIFIGSTPDVIEAESKYLYIKAEDENTDAEPLIKYIEYTLNYAKSLKDIELIDVYDS